MKADQIERLRDQAVEKAKASGHSGIDLHLWAVFEIAIQLAEVNENLEQHTEGWEALNDVMNQIFERVHRVELSLQNRL